MSGAGLSLGSRMRRRRAVLHPSDLSGVVTAWLRVAGATVTGQGISSMPDALNANPAVCATDAARPPRVASAGNGVLVAQGVDDFLSLPPIAANNNLTTWGFGVHVLLDDVSATKPLIRLGNTTTNSFPVATDSLLVSALSDESLFVQVCNDATGGVVRSGFTGPSVLTNAAYTFVTVEFDGGAASDANKLVISVGGAVQTLTFANSVGAPGAMPASLQGQVAGKGIALLNMRHDANLSPFIGKVGPNWYFFGGKMAAATQGLLTPAARIGLRDFEPPA